MSGRSSPRRLLQRRARREVCQCLTVHCMGIAGSQNGLGPDQPATAAVLARRRLRRACWPSERRTSHVQSAPLPQPQLQVPPVARC
jgi:hypothetical protein